MAAEPDAVGELVARCGGVPLALGLIAGRAAAHPRTPLAELAAELRALGIDALDDDLTGLSTVVSWSYRALTERQQLMFGLLGLAPGPDIGLDATACLVGLSPAETRRLLRSLEEASLVLVDSFGRWSMHDLIRQYAANVEMPADVRDAALHRVVDFYLHTAYSGDRLMGPNRTPQQLDPPTCRPLTLPDPLAALVWCDTEHSCLLAAQRTAVDNGWHKEAWLLAWSVSIFHTRRGHDWDNLTVWQAAVAASEHLDDPDVTVLSRRFLGSAHARLGQFDEAIDQLNRCLAIARDDADRSIMHRTLSWTWGQRGDNREALRHATLALELIREVDRPVGKAWALNDVGWYASQLGELELARENCKAALALFREHDELDGESVTWDSLGYIEHHLGNHAEAVQHYGRALALIRSLGATSQLPDTLAGFGHPLKALGRHEEARAAWQEALEIYRTQDKTEDAERVQHQLDALGT